LPLIFSLQLLHLQDEDVKYSAGGGKIEGKLKIKDVTVMNSRNETADEE